MSCVARYGLLGYSPRMYSLGDGSTAGADFVFNIIQRTPGDRFEVGSTVVFDVNLARADGFPSVNNWPASRSLLV